MEVVTQHLLVRALVKRQGFGEAVLPVIDISEIDFQPRQAPRVSLFAKDCSGALASREGLIVPASNSSDWIDPLKVRASSASSSVCSNNATACSYS